MGRGGVMFTSEFVAENYTRAVEIANDQVQRLFGGGGVTYEESFEFTPAPYGRFLCRFTLRTLQP